LTKVQEEISCVWW